MSNGDKYSKTYKDNLCKAIKRQEVSIGNGVDKRETLGTVGGDFFTIENSKNK